MSTDVRKRETAGHAIALMYHALSAGEAPPGQDPHYTVSSGAFVRHLDHLLGPGAVGSTRDWLQGTGSHWALVTFDDGHISNYALAFPALQARGHHADFFVNPAMVGQTGFASWSQLREMSDAGMSIQSHGYDHVYLTSLGGQQLRAALNAAREEISQRIGRPATLLAPPGGRMPRHLAQIARECGYTHVLSSRPGRIDRASDACILPRMSVTATTTEADLEKWIDGSQRTFLRERIRYGSLAMAKRLLGDSRYERARARAMSALRGSA
jgi:peptidoglycan/xylan/chitin deacetylase (PgdA/CDA1 family)